MPAAAHVPDASRCSQTKENICYMHMEGGADAQAKELGCKVVRAARVLAAIASHGQNPRQVGADLMTWYNSEGYAHILDKSGREPPVELREDSELECSDDEETVMAAGAEDARIDFQATVKSDMDQMLDAPQNPLSPHLMPITQMFKLRMALRRSRTVMPPNRH